MMLPMSSASGEGRSRRIASLPFYPLLLAAYPVLFLFSQNLGIVSVNEVVLPLVLTVGAAALGLVVLGLIFRDPRPAALIVAAVAVGILAYGHGLRVAASVHLGGTAFLVVWGGMVLGIALVAVVARRKLDVATRLLNLVAVVLVLTQLVLIVPFEARAMTAGRPAAEPAGPVATGPHTTRDIYYIILDRYGSERSIALNYGITDNGFTDWLEGHGFAVARDSHANYGRTVLSLASTLNMTYLDSLEAQQGPDSADMGPADAMLQDHAVGRLLKESGYRYIHLGSFYTPTRTSAIADANISLGDVDEFMASLYDLTVFPVIARRLGLQRTATLLQKQVDNARYQFRVLDSLRSEPGPKFVFAHILLPHPPYVFAADGRVLDEAEAGQLPVNEQYRGQLLYANSMMESFLEPLLALPDEQRPIIIIQADEGPWPPRFADDRTGFDWTTATTDELEVKFGILNAMLLPGVDPALVYPTISSVNTFRLVFEQYFGSELPLLADRSFTSSGQLRPYDFADISARLPPPR
jgi:hypothetical protein